MAEVTMEEGILINVEGALQPCDICGRTFLPDPLTKHMRVCERNATRKRRVFDSLKQRVEGTELAQFHQRTYIKRQNQTPISTAEANRQSSKWKEKHLELQTTIKAARDFALGIMPTSPKRTPTTTAGSERCPSCDRQFGPKAYDRHVEWCKEHKARIHRSPAEVLLAKERLEARTKYRVPPPKAKRALVRDKYSPTLGSRTESVNSIKSISCTNLERSPSIRKQKGHLNSRTERDLIKLEFLNEPISEAQTRYEENTPKLQIKEKCVPKERKVPVIEGLKSTHLPRLLPREKVNTVDINSSVGGITVSHMSVEDMKDSTRMVTWKDSVHSPTTPNTATSNSSLHKKLNNKKTFQNISVAKKIVDAESKCSNLPNIKNLKEPDKINTSKLRRNCSKIDLIMDSDCCSLDSSRSAKGTSHDDNLKHTRKKIPYKSLNDFGDSLSQHSDDGYLHIPKINKHSLPNVKNKLQATNRHNLSELEEDEPENIMPSKPRIPFSISKYRTSKAESDKKIKILENKFHLPPLDRKCHTITEYEEVELNTIKGDPDEYVSLKDKCRKDSTIGNVVLLSPNHDCASLDSLEIDDAPSIDTVSDRSVVFARIDDQQDIDDCFEDSDNMSDRMKMYDSQGLKNSDFLCTVQDICNKEKHSLNRKSCDERYNGKDTSGFDNTLNGLAFVLLEDDETHIENREQILEDETSSFSKDNESRRGYDTEYDSREENSNDDGEQIVRKGMRNYLLNNVQSDVDEMKAKRRQQRSDASVEKNSYEISTFGTDYEDDDYEADDEPIAIKEISYNLPNNPEKKSNRSSRLQTPDATVRKEGYESSSFNKSYGNGSGIDLDHASHIGTSTRDAEQISVIGMSYYLPSNTETKSKESSRRHSPDATVKEESYEIFTFGKDYENRKGINLKDDGYEESSQRGNEPKGMSYYLPNNIETKSNGSSRQQSPNVSVRKDGYESSSIDKNYSNRRGIDLDDADTERSSKGDEKQIAVTGMRHYTETKSKGSSRHQTPNVSVRKDGYESLRVNKDYGNRKGIDLDYTDSEGSNKCYEEQIAVTRMSYYLPNNTEVKSNDSSSRQTPDATVRKDGHESTSIDKNYGNRRGIDLDDADTERSSKGDEKQIAVTGMRYYLSNNTGTKSKGSSRQQTPNVSVRKDGYESSRIDKNYSNRRGIALDDADTERSSKGDEKQIAVTGMRYYLSNNTETKSKGSSRQQTPNVSVRKDGYESSRVNKDYGNRKGIDFNYVGPEGCSNGDKEQIVVTGMGYYLPNNTEVKSKDSSRRQTPDATVRKDGHESSRVTKDYGNKQGIDLDYTDSEGSNKSYEEQIAVTRMSYYLPNNTEVKSNDSSSRQTPDATVRKDGHESSSIDKNYGNRIGIDLDDADNERSSKGDEKQIAVTRMSYYVPNNTETKSKESSRRQSPDVTVRKDSYESSRIDKNYSNRRGIDLDDADTERSSKGDEKQIAVTGMSYYVPNNTETKSKESSRRQSSDVTVRKDSYESSSIDKNYGNRRGIDLDDADNERSSKGDEKQIAVTGMSYYVPNNTETKSKESSRKQTPDASVNKDEISSFGKDYEDRKGNDFKAGSKHDETAILGTFSLGNYNNNNTRKQPIPHDDIVIPTVAKAQLKFNNQSVNIKNIHMASTSNNDASTSNTLAFVEYTSSITNITSPNSNSTNLTIKDKIVLPPHREIEEGSTSRSLNKNNISVSETSFDIDSLENVHATGSSISVKEAENETSDILSLKYHMEPNSIDNITDEDISILHQPSCEVAEIDSLECIDVNAWNEALSMARMERSIRKCCSAVCLNRQKSQENNFATYTELNLTEYTYNDDSSRACCIHFQYQTDDVIVEGGHIELQYDQTDEESSEPILERTSDQFITTFRGDGDYLVSTRSSASTVDYIPPKRRKLSDDMGYCITSTGSTSECSSICSAFNKIIYEHNLTKNLEKIKSIKQKLEHEVGGGEAITIYEESEDSQDENFENRAKVFQYNLINNCSNDENNSESILYSNKYYPMELENVEKENAVNCPVGTELMEDKTGFNSETCDSRSSLIIASGSVLEKISPRFLNLLESIINDDASHPDNIQDDMLVISKNHCKKLLELDPHMFDLPSTIKLPKIQLRSAKTMSKNRKMISDGVETTKLTLPSISSKCGNASKIPISKSFIGQQRSSTLLCSKELLKLPEINASSDIQSDYNPFVTAERQLMELLECDDFKPFCRNKSPSTQHLQRPHTTTNTKSKLTDIHKNNKVVKSAENARKSNVKLAPNHKRASVIDPPMDFQDNLLSDDFELIERLINQNYAAGYDVNDINFDSISNKIAKNYFLNSETNENNNCGYTAKERKYSDDMSSIDPRLINENDNLSIPENFKIDDNSSNSSIDNVIPLISNLQKENYVSKRVTPKITTTEKINRSLNRQNSVGIKKPKQINDEKKSIKPIKQATKGSYKSTTSLTSSYGSTRNNFNTDKKKNLSTLKRSVSLVDPVKPKNLKNKQDVENYFDEQDRKTAIKTERISPDPPVHLREGSPEQQALKNQKNENNSNISHTPTAEELFSVDDEMYEEYKKYEEMYLREKQQHMQNEKKPDDLVSSGTLTPNEGSDNVPTNVKVSADSAYSSLNRNTPKIRARSTKLAPLDFQASNSSPDSPHSSGSEDTSPTFKRSLGSQRMSKFCHECGNKYPINTAKFCVECGVRRLVL